MELKWAKLAGNFAALLMVTAAMTIYAHIELKTPAHFVLILNSAQGLITAKSPHQQHPQNERPRILVKYFVYSCFLTKRNKTSNR